MIGVKMKMRFLELLSHHSSVRFHKRKKILIKMQITNMLYQEMLSSLPMQLPTNASVPLAPQQDTTWRCLPQYQQRSSPESAGNQSVRRPPFQIPNVEQSRDEQSYRPGELFYRNNRSFIGADWLQGPHVYALYSSYGLTSLQISQLFVAGFGSSMIFGTVVGSFADKLGRKVNCILYGILYGIDCLTKHVPNFWVLMIGRLMGGIATSILFSAFESWLVCEHSKRGFSKDLLSVVFSHAVLGNSVVAIISGLLAQGVASQFGFVAPFTLSLILLLLVSGLVYLLWTENYGDSSGNFYKSFLSGLSAIKNDSKILCLGLIQSLFEGSMYTFVLEWTPALTPVDKLGTKDVKETIPHGWIFASYMVSIMLGSSIFKYMCRKSSPESFMRAVFAVAAMTLAVPIISPKSQTSIFIAFVVFEVCVGIFWPALGTMRSKYVPEESRATIMNMFRIPLNFIVIVILLQDLPMALIFKCCVIFLSTCCAIQHWMYKACPQTNGGSTRQALIVPEDIEES